MRKETEENWGKRNSRRRESRKGEKKDEQDGKEEG